MAPSSQKTGLSFLYFQWGLLLPPPSLGFHLPTEQRGESEAPSLPSCLPCAARLPHRTRPWRSELYRPPTSLKTPRH